MTVSRRLLEHSPYREPRHDFSNPPKQGFVATNEGRRSRIELLETQGLDPPPLLDKKTRRKQPPVTPWYLKVADKVFLAERHAVVPQAIVGGGGMEVEIWVREIEQVLHSFELVVLLPEL